ncbi:MAG: acyltransferase [Bacteroidales bacterium]|jgi:hypothetical protein|nr:acyltransferase [Bacteroidales bacterium]
MKALSPPTPSKPRIEYVDMLRGFAMLWVVCQHLEIYFGDPEGNYRMPILFFISGAFFKLRPTKEFVIRKINMNIVPLVFFWFISWLLMTFYAEFVAVGFDLTKVVWADVFDFFGKYSVYQVDDRIMWFIITLFLINMFFYPLLKYFPHKYVFLLSLVLFMGGGLVERLLDYPTTGILATPVEFLFFQLFFITGVVFGKILIQWINENKHIYVVLSCCLVIFVSFLFIHWEYGYLQKIPKRVHDYLSLMSFLIIALWIFSKLQAYHLAKICRFIGSNSLVVYAMHMLVYLYFYKSLVEPLVLSYIDVAQYALAYKWFVFLFLVISCTGFIYLFNKYLPAVIGKKDFFKIKSSS